MAEKRKNGSASATHFRKGYTGKKLPAKIIPPKGPAASVPVPKKQKPAASS